MIRLQHTLQAFLLTDSFPQWIHLKWNMKPGPILVLTQGFFDPDQSFHLSSQAEPVRADIYCICLLLLLLSASCQTGLFLACMHPAIITRHVTCCDVDICAFINIPSNAVHCLKPSNHFANSTFSLSTCNNIFSWLSQYKLKPLMFSNERNGRF